MHQDAHAQLDVSQILWESYIKAGQSALRLKNSDEAHRMFSMALEKCDPHYDEWRLLATLRWIAVSLCERKNYAEAEKTLNKMLQEVYARFGAEAPEALELTKWLAFVMEKQDR